jgi:RyR domain-containing protein
MDMTKGPSPIPRKPGVDEAYGAMLGWIGANFEQEDGATARLTQNGLPYYTLRLAVQDDGSNRAWEVLLTRAFQDLMMEIKLAGAVKLIWRTRPYLDYDEEDQTHYIRARLVSLNKEGKEVISPRAVAEGAPTPRIVPPGMPPEMPPLGYDFLGPREEAVVLCGLICHNVVKALNDSRGEFTVSWDESRASTMQGVIAILDNPLLTPEQSHQSWMDFKVAQGWKFGPNKDPVAKTHPLMIPYSELPKEQQVKDAIFGAIVRTFFGI